MKRYRSIEVAVLLATYNGGRYIESQIESLESNEVSFKLHWLDDQSTDDTRDRVRAAARGSNITLCEWHQSQHLGIPAAYFQLLECVEADIYLFCDQDDIWQPGKIDATVTDLEIDLASAALCFSEPLVFEGDEPKRLRRLSNVLGIEFAVARQESRLFMHTPACGHTMGFTRVLRELYLRHKNVARMHAIQHDWWIYIIAHVSCSPRVLANAPTTLYRRHDRNFTSPIYQAIESRGGRLVSMWGQQRLYRPAFARQARGFLLASPTLPRGPKLDRLNGLARLVARIDRRQSPLDLIRLVHRRVMNPIADFTVLLAVACLYADVRSEGSF